MANNNGNRSGRGFAGMSAEEQRRIASKGGKAAHEKGTAHEFDSEEAARAGSKGGKASHSSRGSGSNSSDDSRGRGSSSSNSGSGRERDSSGRFESE